MSRKKGLGKGLSALMEDNSLSIGESGESLIKISEIQPNKNQPRKDFDQSKLEQLAESIRENGIIQPLILRELGTDGYQIVAGERRYRAARMLGLMEVPAIVRELDDLQVMQIALIENLQREDLNAIEEALGYRDLMSEFSFTQEEVSKAVGKSRPAIANALRLLNLPDIIIEMVRKSEISSGHARALLPLENESAMISLAKMINKKDLTVRDIEKTVKKRLEEFDITEKSAFPANDYYKEMQLALTNELGRKIKINKGKNKGSISIEFYDDEELKIIAEQLCKQ